MSKSNGGKTTYVPTEFQFYAPKEKQSIGQFIYNSKDGTYFGRTPKSWGQLMLFYGIFYIVLAGLFTICMEGLFSTLHDNEPKWKLDESLIGTNPGMGFRPLSEETERGSVIQFDTKKNAEKKYWIDLLDEYMKDYNETHVGKSCSFNQTHNPEDVCMVDIKEFGGCSPQKAYGYNNTRPCVFLKLNKIFKWVPEFYDDPKDLPETMPVQLKKHIEDVDPLSRQQIWVSCDGTNAEDKENLGEVKYYPSQGFPAYYYPFLNQPGYLSPLIAVQFEKLPLNKMVNIECRAWAKNIIYSGSVRDRKGSVTFQIFID
ncbi:sodium/potassium-transporting ATPase subunit beta-1 [Lucilia sericata]|uniref:sodium/potassium-transporting ATPase subunit beta-1 n=1 Tax=Lucilia sericata TaxID=13632 RepID=UPI0018A83A63|nr:sodium/potassium-transporting ATPase subunit beta-1 [Lucilia sericata]XP_037828600.1 sodium/potassium-transporting ATPase subunit beta-1 [Lucilia sericata]